MNILDKDKITGIWSASPTPFDHNFDVDEEAVKRLTAHHRRLKVNGLFLAGTCGEGPWLTRGQRSKLISTTVQSNKDEMLISAQATDNSEMQMLDNIKMYKDLGVDIAVLAMPHLVQKATQKYILEMFLNTIDKSPLPVGFYHRGSRCSFEIDQNVLNSILIHPKVVLVKDSSCSNESKATILKVRNSKTDGRLFALNGNEFDCVTYLTEGYDGLLLGGASFNGYMAKNIFDLVKNNNITEANNLQEKMNNLMYDVFGGKDVSCWLAGQKQMMVELGVFNTCKTIINYSLSTKCAKSIKAAFKREKNYLLPNI